MDGGRGGRRGNGRAKGEGEGEEKEKEGEDEERDTGSAVTLAAALNPLNPVDPALDAVDPVAELPVEEAWLASVWDDAATQAGLEALAVEQRGGAAESQEGARRTISGVSAAGGIDVDADEAGRAASSSESDDDDSDIDVDDDPDHAAAVRAARELARAARRAARAAGRRKDDGAAGPFISRAAAEADIFVGVSEARPASPLFDAAPSPRLAPLAAAALGADGGGPAASFLAYRGPARPADDDDEEEDDGRDPETVFAEAMAAATAAMGSTESAAVPSADVDRMPGVADPPPVLELPGSPPAAAATTAAAAADADDEDRAYWARIRRMHVGDTAQASPFEILFDGRLDDGRALDASDLDLLVASVKALAVTSAASARPDHDD